MDEPLAASGSAAAPPANDSRRHQKQSHRRQLWALTRKNVTLKLRNRSQLLCEMLTPLFLMSFIVYGWAKSVELIKTVPAEIFVDNELDVSYLPDVLVDYRGNATAMLPCYELGKGVAETRVCFNFSAASRAPSQATGLAALMPQEKASTAAEARQPFKLALRAFLEWRNFRGAVAVPSVESYIAQHKLLLAAVRLSIQLEIEKEHPSVDKKKQNMEIETRLQRTLDQYAANKGDVDGDVHDGGGGGGGGDGRKLLHVHLLGGGRGGGDGGLKWHVNMTKAQMNTYVNAKVRHRLDRINHFTGGAFGNMLFLGDVYWSAQPGPQQHSLKTMLSYFK
jgi:hypothetical protein